MVNKSEMKELKEEKKQLKQDLKEEAKEISMEEKMLQLYRMPKKKIRELAKYWFAEYKEIVNTNSRLNQMLQEKEIIGIPINMMRQRKEGISLENLNLYILELDESHSIPNHPKLKYDRIYLFTKDELDMGETPLYLENGMELIKQGEKMQAVSCGYLLSGVLVVLALFTSADFQGYMDVIITEDSLAKTLLEVRDVMITLMIAEYRKFQPSLESAEIQADDALRDYKRMVKKKQHIAMTDPAFQEEDQPPKFVWKTWMVISLLVLGALLVGLLVTVFIIQLTVNQGSVQQMTNSTETIAAWIGGWR